MIAAAAETDAATSTKHAKLYRMVMPEHICPFGLKAKALLERQGFEVEDHHLETRAATDAFKQEHHVETTPQVFINGARIGGYDAVKEHLGVSAPKNESDTTYEPIIAVFSVAALMAAAIAWAAFGDIFRIRTIEWFIAVSMCILAVLKLRDLSSFTNQFLGYDLLAQRYVRYAYFYPFAEAFAGVLMVAGAFLWFASPLAIFIGTVGAASVVKAVYVDKRDLKCACVGGDSNVPLGAISLTENVMMVMMGIWMLVKPAIL
ncbi:MauE/DoxX family redox-associated membrane protein [Hyphococcus sp.]|uniref:MauE/DoxX family redox-associated membrane protein n=1 Tax=Hyphococcus sp. TaxID=2038636 RepID=UPI003CCC0339